jgi:hypothetical protein
MGRPGGLPSLEQVGIIMADEEKPKRSAEEVAEKTGETIGKGLKKGFGIFKAVGKGVKDEVVDKKKK